MGIIEICKTNALIFSEEICKLNPNPFPEYFDWSDHIAIKTETKEDYQYHLNKTALDIEKLINIFRPYLADADFRIWEEGWYFQTLAAAWIHDIGMLKNRSKHSVGTAEALFEENEFGIDFKGIGIEDRVKIGMICIRHNNGWPGVWKEMKDVLEKKGKSLDTLKQSFADHNTPKWELDFSGRMLSVADGLRYRGVDLKNDLQQPFSLWSECGVCKTTYSETRDFCETTNCESDRPGTLVVIRHWFDKVGFDPGSCSESTLYKESGSGAGSRVEDKISDTYAHISVRGKNQLHTRGDMSLSNVKIVDFNSWMNDLLKRGIDIEVMDDYILDYYKTVVSVDFDMMNQDAALFTLYEYIVRYLHQNVAAESDTPIDSILLNSNYTILHITVSNNNAFSQCFNDILTNPRLAPEVRDAVVEFDRVLQKWKDLYGIVLPMEIIENKLEVISL